MRKLFCILLAVVLLMPCIPVQAEKTGSQNTVDGILYGTISVLTEGKAAPQPFRAAKDINGTVYIHLGDFARVIGASLEETSAQDSYCYRFGNWNLVVFCREKAAKLYYNPGGDPKTKGYALYGQFPLDKVVYQKQTGHWYLPMDKMLYMSLNQWICAEGFVTVYRPQNLLDVLCNIGEVSDNNPNFTHIQSLMGEDAWSQWGNSFKYGFLAGADEIDATFIADSVLIGFQVKDTSTYEDNVLRDSLLLLADDSPNNETDEKIRQMGSETFDSMTSFASNASVALGLVDADKQTAAFQLLAKALGNPLTKTELSEIKAVTGSIGDSVAVAEQATDLVFGVANTLWTRNFLTDNFKDRLDHLQACTADDLDNDWAKQLNKAAKDANKLYYGDFAEVVGSHVTLSHILGTADAVAGMTGGIPLLNTPMMLLSLYDFTVETSKLVFPAVGEAFENAENVHNTLNMINIYSYMLQEANTSTNNILSCTGGMKQKQLDEIRLNCQIAQNVAMHTHCLLADMDIMSSETIKPGAELLQNLTLSAKHDALLLIDKSFTGLESDKDGCIRMEIPPEYVVTGDGIFLAPVNQLTAAPAGWIAIETEEDLRNVAKDMTGSYILMEDLEIQGWEPLGNDTLPFSGTFNGNGHSITINLEKSFDATDDVYGGVFCLVSGVVKNLHIKGDWVYQYQESESAKSLDQYTCIGGIAAKTIGAATIHNCVSSVNISHDAPYWLQKSKSSIAGIVGDTSSDFGGSYAWISYCRNFGTIENLSKSAGIVCFSNDASIYACQNDGTVTSLNAAGITYSSSGTITSCANRGEITGTAESGAIAYEAVYIEDCVNVGILYTQGQPVGYSGGIVNSSKWVVKNCVNNGQTGHISAGICGNFRKGGSIEGGYWIETEKQLFANVDMVQTMNGIDRQSGKLTAEQMTMQESFVGFDFMNDWTLYEGMACPYPSALLQNGQQPPMLENN